MEFPKEFKIAIERYHNSKPDDLRKWVADAQSIEKEIMDVLMMALGRKNFDYNISVVNYTKGTLDIFTEATHKAKGISFYIDGVPGLGRQVVQESPSTFKEFIDAYDNFLDRINLVNKTLHWQRHMVGIHFHVGIFNDNELKEDYFSNLKTFISQLPYDAKDIIAVLENMDYVITKDSKSHEKFLNFTKTQEIFTNSPFCSFIHELVYNKVLDEQYMDNFGKYSNANVDGLIETLQELKENLEPWFKSLKTYQHLNNSLTTKESKSSKNKI